MVPISDVDGVIEDLDVLMRDLLDKIAKASVDYLDVGEGGDADERLERLVYGRFLEPEARKAFFEAYKDIENLWEILSPSKELVDHIGTFKRLAQLYAAVRNAYADKVGFIADLAHKTRQLVQQNAMQDGLGRLTKSVTFDVKTLDALRSEKGSDEGKVFNLVRGLQKEIDDNADGTGASAAEGSGGAYPQGPRKPQYDRACGDGPTCSASRGERRRRQRRKGYRPDAESLCSVLGTSRRGSSQARGDRYAGAREGNREAAGSISKLPRQCR
jgi:hypothetical protein